MSDRYSYSSISKVETEKPTVMIYFSNIVDNEPDLKVQVELFGMFDPNQTVQAMNLRTLICLNEEMIIFHLNKFGFAEKVENEVR